MDQNELKNSAMEQLRSALEAEEVAQKNFHIREAIQMLNLTEAD